MVRSILKPGRRHYGAVDRALRGRNDGTDHRLPGGVNKSTAAFYSHRLREIIAHQSEDAASLCGEIEVDESYPKVIPDVKGKTLKSIIDVKIAPGSIVYSTTLNSYNVLDAFRKR